MENMSPISSSHVVFAFNATKDRTEEELKLTIEGIQMADGILRGGDTLFLLGIVQRIMHPSKHSINFLRRLTS